MKTKSRMDTEVALWTREVKGQHTPGPWHVNMLEISPHTVHAAGGCICECHGRPEIPLSAYSTDQREANARLIAAAPALVEALRGMLSPMFLDVVADHESNCVCGSCVRIHKARAALKLSEG